MLFANESMLIISPEFLEFRNSNLSPLMLLVGETPFDVWILLAFDSCWSYSEKYGKLNYKMSENGFILPNLILNS